jgi:hypothetical protein
MSTVDPDDKSGVNSMPYKDYCVTVVDKVLGQFYSGDEMVPGYTRSIERDVMKFMFKETDINGEGGIVDYPGFPDTLRLDDLVTCPTCFFNPLNPVPGGFTYVEVYDPEYWMIFKGLSDSLSCYKPMYRMISRSTNSPLDQQTIALIITKYRISFENDIAAGKPVTILPADSFHFGFPLWFFEHDKVHQIMDEIFAEWQILDE